MLPGFRFVLVATILTMSLVIFGLGAAALLRATHEEFVSIPSRRPPPDMLMARQPAPVPSLSMVREWPEPQIGPVTGAETPADATSGIEPPAQVAGDLPVAALPEPATPDVVLPSGPPALPAPETYVYAAPSAAAATPPADALALADPRAEEDAASSVTPSVQHETSVATADPSGIARGTGIGAANGPATVIAPPPTAVKKPVAAKPKAARRKVVRRAVSRAPRVAQQDAQQPFAPAFSQPAFPQPALQQQRDPFGGFPR